MVIDASLFVPQSRPRLFIVGVHNSINIPDAIKIEEPSSPWHTRTLVKAYEKLSSHNKDGWVWWDMPKPKSKKLKFSDLIEDDPDSVSWHTPEQTAQLLSMMSKIHLDKVEKAKQVGKRIVGTIYKRTRTDEFGGKVQRAEVRFDSVAGCLRTPAGGSSRQLIVVVEGDDIRSRLISSRETARLMGLPDTYKLPDTYNEAYHLTGDGVVVPVVRHLVSKIVEPIVLSQEKSSRVAA
jgi:DNA (cytosine-5)-methyltransferase 1